MRLLCVTLRLDIASVAREVQSCTSRTVSADPRGSLLVVDPTQEFVARSQVTPERRAAQAGTLQRLSCHLEGASVLDADAHALQAYLDARRAQGLAPNSVRKERAILLSFYTWAWREGDISAETLLSLRAVPAPTGSTGVAQPHPYKRWEIRELW